jgi:hypothetical protein
MGLAVYVVAGSDVSKHLLPRGDGLRAAACRRLASGL